MTWQITDVKKPLASTGRVCDAGNVAVFTNKGGYIIGRGGAKDIMEVVDKRKSEAMEMRRENGVYNFSIRIPCGEDNTEMGTRGVPVRNRYAALAESSARDNLRDNPADFHGQGRGRF